MSVRLAAAIVTTCLCSGAQAQTPAPDLTRQQRDLLTEIVAAVDAAGGHTETAGLQWQHHLLRASDGSHYVAFSAAPPAAMPLPNGSVLLYVRLATATPPGTQPIVERSPVREWLAGNTGSAPPPAARRGIALGEMPIMGTAGSVTRRPQVTEQMSDVSLMDLERRRARERADDLEKQRRAEREGRATPAADTLPFEDFGLTPAAAVIQRALTTGPGDYWLYLAWAEPSAPKPSATVHVIKKRLTIPIASATQLSISSVILAERIHARATAGDPAQQASHPYAIGTAEIVPALDATFADGEHLSAVFQVINPQPAGDGKPDVDVAFQIVQRIGDRENAVASLTPQSYSSANLPAEFDLRAGHPLFASLSAPLATLKRGDYRLEILVNDKVARRTATAEIDFTVTATAAALLREAPGLGAPFRLEAVLAGDVLPAILAALKPGAPSAPLQRAFEHAEAGRFVELMVEEPIPQTEEGVRAALRGLALLAVGDASAAVQFQRAQLLGAPLAPSRFLSGAARAMQSRDVDAIAGWQEALAAGAPRSMVVPFLVDAHLRRNDFQRAAALLDAGAAATWSRSTAAVLIGARKELDAVRLIDARLAEAPDDRDAQWLLLHALFAQLAGNAKAPAALRDRFATQARAYIDANGVHRALAAEWLKAIASV